MQNHEHHDDSFSQEPPKKLTPRRSVVEPVSAYGNGAPESTNRLVTLALLAFLIAILSLAREVLIPMALGGLLSFLLAIPAKRLERMGCSRVFSSVAVAVAAFMIMGGVGYIMISHLIDLGAQIPKYEANLAKKVGALRPTSGSTLNKIKATFTNLGKEMSKVEEAVVTTGTPNMVQAKDPTMSGSTWDGKRKSTEEPPLPVKIVEMERTPVQVVQSWAGAFLSRLGTIGIVVIFVLFMLIQREDLRDRIVRLAGQRRITVTTQALDEAGERVSRYLFMQLIINVTYGIPVALGLWLIGVPNAFLWGLLATLLRFIPYIGPWIAAIAPIALSMAAFDSWFPVFLVVGLFLILELVSNNIMEPLLYGHSTGMTPFAVLVSAVFWTWLWGGVGLFLATPLTVCLVVLGRYVPQLHFIEVLLGDEPVLTPSERLYQRLLAMDMDDVVELTEGERKGRSLVEVYDDLLMPVLAMAERDRHRGTLLGRRGEFAMTGIESMIEEIAMEPEAPAEKEPSEKEAKALAERELAQQEASQIREAAAALATGAPVHHPNSGEAAPVLSNRVSITPLEGLRVLVLPAKDEADMLAARMLVNLLNKEYARAWTVPVSTMGVEMVEIATAEQPDVVVVSAMPPLAISSARLLARRLRSEGKPELRLIIGLWSAEGDMQRCLERLRDAAPEAVITSLSDALLRIPPTIPAAPPPAFSVTQSATPHAA